MLGPKCLFFVDNDPEVVVTELLGIPVYRLTIDIFYNYYVQVAAVAYTM